MATRPTTPVLEVFPGWRKTISRRFDSLCRFGLAITSKARASGARFAQVVCEPEKTYAKIKKKACRVSSGNDSALCGNLSGGAGGWCPAAFPLFGGCEHHVCLSGQPFQLWPLLSASATPGHCRANSG